MKKKASRKRHMFLSKNFIMMFVMLVAIAATVFSWYTSGQTVTANGITVKSNNPGIDLAPCIKTYDAGWNVVTDGPGEFGNEMTFSDFTLTKDCTGDGVNLWVPDFNVTNDFDNVRRNGGKDVNLNVSGTTAHSQEYSRIEHEKDQSSDAPEYQYIELEFYARTQNEQLTLSASSSLRSVTEVGGTSLSVAPGAGDSKRSAYGAFNVDGLVGAMRVALIGEVCNEVNQTWSQDTATTGRIQFTDCPLSSRSDPTKQILWYPRPDLKLNIPETAGDITNWTLQTGLTSGDTFTNSYYQNTASGMTLVSPDNDSKTKVSTAAPTLGTSVDISDFGSFEQQKVTLVKNKNQYQQTDEYYLYKYTLRVWIEGSDSEARRAMDGGQFNLTLKFE